MYDYLIVTHLPAFYKVNLYNELSLSLNIFVIFIANNTIEKRFNNFADLKNSKFKYSVICKGDFQTRNKFKSIIYIRNMLKEIEYKKILLGGWDLIEYWYLAFKNCRENNCLALESTTLESKSKGFRGLIKKIFLFNISIVFASGDLHVELLRKLNYKKKIIITKGVGLINKPDNKKIEKKYTKSFIYIGRITFEKNLELLIKIFNELPDYLLTIVGEGPEENTLKKMSNKNIKFQKSIENENLNKVLIKNNILILASISETWGLVTEEALYYGLPVIISKNCGARELIKNGINGFIVDPFNLENIKKTILKIDKNVYKKLEEGVVKCSLNEKDINQVQAYNIF